MVVKASASRPPRPGKADPAVQGLLDAVPLPAAALDLRGRILALNAAWHDAARPGGLVATSDAPGRDHLKDLREEKGFARDAGRTLADALEAVLEGEPRRQCQYQVGEPPQSWEATLSRVPLEQDVVLLVHRDVSEDDRGSALATRIDRLATSNEQAAAIARDRKRLLATAEQSFSAPLTPIRLQLHLLRSQMLGDLNDRQVGALERLERNVARWHHLQERLVSDLLSLEQPDHAPEVVDAGELFDEAMGVFHERALKAGIRLRVDRTKDPLHVVAERRPFVQVVMLLLDHAIRETPSGGLVWVRLRPSNGSAELVIQDQDPIIEPQDVAAIWNDEADDTSLRGAMRYSQSVVERNGGGLQLNCDGPGRGLEAVIHLPLSSGTDGASATEEAAHSA